MSTLATTTTAGILAARPTLPDPHTDVIRATLPLVGSRIKDITPLFYAKMFARHPELIRDLFNRGNQAQGDQPRALAASIAVFATHLVDSQAPNPVDLLARIGHKHVSLGVTEDQYQIVHDNLFDAIVEVLGADVVTPEVAAAWDAVYWLMARVLIDLEKALYREAGVADGDVFRDTVVVNRTDEPGTGVAVITVAAADPARPLPTALPGQYVSVGARLPDGARQLRQYSLVGSPAGHLAFAVRRVDADAAGNPAGEVSTWLHANACVGSTLQITLPFGDLTPDPEATTPLVLVSAGIGVTPMIGILRGLAESGSGRRVVALHADRSPAAHPLATDQRSLVDALGAELHLWYEADAADARDGLLDIAEIDLPADADVYLCGPTGFLQGVRAQLHALHVPAERVHVELFGPNDWLLDG